MCSLLPLHWYPQPSVSQADIDRSASALLPLSEYLQYLVFSCGRVSYGRVFATSCVGVWSALSSFPFSNRSLGFRQVCACQPKVGTLLYTAAVCRNYGDYLQGKRGIRLHSQRLSGFLHCGFTARWAVLADNITAVTDATSPIAGDATHG